MSSPTKRLLPMTTAEWMCGKRVASPVGEHAAPHAMAGGKPRRANVCASLFWIHASGEHGGRTRRARQFAGDASGGDATSMLYSTLHSFLCGVAIFR